MTRLERLAGLFTTDPFPDIKTVLADAAREGGWGNLTFKDRENHVYLNGERKGAFIGTEGDRQYIATNSSSFPIKGNKVTATAQLLKCSNREAFNWLCEKYNISDQVAEEYKKKAPAWDGAFISWAELTSRAEARHDQMNPSRVCTFGIEELDENIGGIFPSDLVVLGAAPGFGKSEMLLNIGYANAKAGKKVVYYQLEMDEEDPVDRRVLGHMNNKKFAQGKKFIDPIDFRMNTLNAEDSAIKTVAYEEERRIGENMIVYVGESLNFGRFLESLEAVREKGVDLIILDHLHYFSMDEGVNMSESLGKVMREIRIMTKKYKIPIVVVSQLRKPAQYGAKPTMYDLHGSGDIAKEATTVLLLHRGDGKTSIIIDKSRHFGRMDYEIGLQYDPNLRTYTKGKKPPAATNNHLPDLI